MKPLYETLFSAQPVDESRETEPSSVNTDAIYLSWLFWVMHLMGELAFAGWTIVLCFSFVEPAPGYFGWIGLISYLTFGLYLLVIVELRSSSPNLVLPWWRLMIAILSWPFHQALVEFLKGLDSVNQSNPQTMLDSRFMYKTLYIAILKWGGAWVGIIILSPLVVAMIWWFLTF